MCVLGHLCGCLCVCVCVCVAYFPLLKTFLNVNLLLRKPTHKDATSMLEWTTSLAHKKLQSSLHVHVYMYMYTSLCFNMHSVSVGNRRFVCCFSALSGRAFGLSDHN